MFKNPFTLPRAHTHVLDSGTQINGTFRFSRRLLLIGHLQGELVGETKGNEAVVRGQVTGPVRVETLFVEGTIHGDVTAQTVVIHKGGVIRGRVETEVLHLLKGGLVEGELHVNRASATEPDFRRDGSAQTAKARLQQVTGSVSTPATEAA